MSTELARYDAMRRQVEQCARVDEAAELKNKADKLQAYAKQAKDRELQRWAGEIKTRAEIKLGLLSRALPKGEKVGGAGNFKVPSGGKFKAEALAEAGISQTAAHRAEALTGRGALDADDPVAVEMVRVSLETAEGYFDECRKAGAVPNHTQLNQIVQDQLDTQFGPPQSSVGRPKRDAITNAWIDWTNAVNFLAHNDGELEQLAKHRMCSPRDLENAKRAWGSLNRWIRLLGGAHN